MSNSPTLPPAASLQRKPTPLPTALTGGSDAHLQAALAASARAEANLSSLFRAIQHLGTGVGGAREANESLTVELEALRELLGTANEQQRLFERKVAELEGVLDRSRKEHQRERTFLIDQQDSFLVTLLDEQEAELKRRDGDLEMLRGRLAELERRQLPSAPSQPQLRLPGLPAPARESIPAPDSDAEVELKQAELAENVELRRTAQKLAEDRERARETVARLQTQRDEAQTAVARISKERDEALHEIIRLKSELGGPRIPLSTRPPSDGRRDSSAGRASTLTLDQIEMESRLNRPTASPASSPRSSSAAPSSPSSQGLPSARASSTSQDALSAAPLISSVLSPPRSNPNAAPLPTRLSPPPARLSPSPARYSQPPEELRRALTNPPSTPSLASSRPPLKQKPDPSTRPLVGYSLSNESIEPEHMEGVRLSSKPAPPGSGRR